MQASVLGLHRPLKEVAQPDRIAVIISFAIGSRNSGKPRLNLAPRPLLTQHNRPAVTETDDMKRVLPDIDADHADRLCRCCRHGVLLVWVPLASLALAG